MIAQSDDEAVRDMPIDLAEYPEIMDVMRTQKPLVIAGPVARPFFDLMPRGIISEAAPGFRRRGDLLPNRASQAVPLHHIRDRGRATAGLHGFTHETSLQGERV